MLTSAVRQPLRTPADVNEIVVARREMSDTELLPKPAVPVPKPLNGKTPG